MIQQRKFSTKMCLGMLEIVGLNAGILESDSSVCVCVKANWQSQKTLRFIDKFSVARIDCIKCSNYRLESSKVCLMKPYFGNLQA